MIAGLEEKVKEIMIKNAAAENRIIELEKQLQLLKQGEGGLQSDWLTISWNDDSDVQAANGETDNLIPVLPVYVKMSQFDTEGLDRNGTVVPSTVTRGATKCAYMSVLLV